VQTLSTSPRAACVPESCPAQPFPLTLTGNDPVNGGVVVVPAARQPRKVLHRLPKHRRTVSYFTITQCITCSKLKAMRSQHSPLERGLYTAPPPECQSAGSRQCAGQGHCRNHQTHHPACVRERCRTDVLISTCGAPTPTIAAPATRNKLLSRRQEVHACCAQLTGHAPPSNMSIGACSSSCRSSSGIAV
jgi:hypothetical protein